MMGVKKGGSYYDRLTKKNKELIQNTSVGKYISIKAYKMRVFDTKCEDGSPIDQNEETLSNIISFLSLSVASRLSMVSKEAYRLIKMKKV